MKSPTAYYLLLLYVVLVFKPALPVISNLVAHAFAGVAHVANVHAKYGSNHVQNEVGETTQKENKTNHQAELKQQFQVVSHVVTENSTLPPAAIAIKGQFNAAPVPMPVCVYMNVVIPPPKRFHFTPVV